MILTSHSFQSNLVLLRRLAASALLVVATAPFLVGLSASGGDVPPAPPPQAEQQPQRTENKRYQLYVCRARLLLTRRQSGIFRVVEPILGDFPRKEKIYVFANVSTFHPPLPEKAILLLWRVTDDCYDCLAYDASRGILPDTEENRRLVRDPEYLRRVSRTPEDKWIDPGNALLIAQDAITRRLPSARIKRLQMSRYPFGWRVQADCAETLTGTNGPTVHPNVVRQVVVRVSDEGRVVRFFDPGHYLIEQPPEVTP